MPKSFAKPRPTDAAAPRAWQRMLSGRRLDLLDPSPFDIEIEDIAHGLARVARWNGQTAGAHAFSVAQHSVCVLDWVVSEHPDWPADWPADWRLYALLHDAPEFVIGDMITPFKAVLGEQYRAIERRLAEAIHLRFGLAARPPQPIEMAIKAADRAMAYHEAVQLAGFSRAEADKVFARPSRNHASLAPLPAEEAQRLFLTSFSGIMGN